MHRVLAPSTQLRSRHWTIALFCLFLFALYNVQFSGPTQLLNSAEKSAGKTSGDSCSAALASHVEILKKEYRALLPGVTHVAVIGYPDHANKGDAAIWTGESILLQALDIQPVYICIDQKDYNATLLRQSLVEHGGPEKTAIIYHGGGNFGDIWHGPQMMRETVATDFLDYRIRSFPQTYKFHDDKNLEQAQTIFGQHPDLQLTARDTRSYMDMQKDFGGKHKVILVPDVAPMLITTPPPERSSRGQGLDFLFLARTDQEGAQNHWNDKATIEELKHVTNAANEEVETSLIIQDWLGKQNNPHGLEGADWDGRAWLKVNWAFDLLGQGALILSDRLHVHILSTVWGFDHIVVEEGKYAKLKTYHETWLLNCGNRVVMTQSVREAVDAAKKWYRRGRKFS